MPGPTRTSPLSDVVWTDAEIQSVRADYDTVCIELLESTGRRRVVKCRGHIGYQLVGFWDEIVVERAEFVERDPFLDDCIRAIRRANGEQPMESGDPIRNKRTWRVLLIHLADGAVLRVAAGQFTSE
jgi:hypothetical protein